MTSSLGAALRAVCFGLLLLASPYSHPATVTGSGNVLPSLYVFTDYGSGDVLFKTTTAPSGCDGYWLRPSDGGYRASLAAVYLALSSNRTVQVLADDTVTWSGGSSSTYCRVQTIIITS